MRLQWPAAASAADPDDRVWGWTVVVVVAIAPVAAAVMFVVSVVVVGKHGAVPVWLPRAVWVGSSAGLVIIGASIVELRAGVRAGLNDVGGLLWLTGLAAGLVTVALSGLSAAVVLFL